MSTTREHAEHITHPVGESSQLALTIMQRSSGPMQRYVRSSVDWTINKYQQSPTSVRLFLLGFGAMSAIPVGCFLGFMAVVTLGCLIVGGIAFAIVEGGFALFGSAFLLPALGVMLLIACGVGIVSLCFYGCYIVAIYIIGFFRPSGGGHEIERRAQATTERTREKAPEIAQRGG